MQRELQERIADLEAQLKEQGARVKASEQDIKLMADKIDQEYREFARNRKRWKSEFGLATDKADTLMATLRRSLDTCMGQNQHNTAAIKMLLDTQMIEHLI